jgi:septal ring factor EnvC (AmiA/AmiB activator)
VLARLLDFIWCADDIKVLSGDSASLQSTVTSLTSIKQQLEDALKVLAAKFEQLTHAHDVTVHQLDQTQSSSSETIATLNAQYKAVRSDPSL